MDGWKLPPYSVSLAAMLPMLSTQKRPALARRWSMLALAMFAAWQMGCGASIDNSGVTGPISTSPSALTPVSSLSFTGIAGAPLASLPSVKVATATGAPVQGTAVTFAVTAGGGSITGASATTDASGIATLSAWTLGPIAGTNAITATTRLLPQRRD
ncbi:hypothetical protein BH09GEM1_BH09GEM1_14230 [soil metagenome]